MAGGVAVRAVVMSVLVLIATACSGRGAASDTDSWCAAPPSDLSLPAQWEELDQNRLRIVHGQLLGQAVDLLDQVIWMPISPVQAQEMTDMPFDGSGGFYLVRGLYLNWETEGFTARVLDGRVWISHRSAQGAGAVPMKRQPVVVKLDAAPTQIYVTCSTTE